MWTVIECAAPKNGIYTVPVEVDMTMEYGEIYNYKCLDGLETTDELSTTCKIDGTQSLLFPPICGTCF